MTQGEIEKLALKTGNIFSQLEMRIMTDIVRRIRENGFSTASADRQIMLMQKLGESEESIKAWIKEALKASDEEMDRIFSDEVYRQYYGFDRAYKAKGFQQIPLEDNVELQQLIGAVKKQLSGEYENLAASMGFAVRDPQTGRLQYPNRARNAFPNGSPYRPKAGTKAEPTPCTSHCFQTKTTRTAPHS